MYATYTDTAIMTVGATAEEAVAEMEEIGGLPFSDLSDTYCREITSALGAYIDDQGGVGIRWGVLADGRLCTEEEES